MKLQGNTGGSWPTGEQELLLKASLLKGRDAAEAWSQWIAAVNIEDIDAGTYRLLPLLYYNLRSLGIEHPLMKKLKGTRRHTWYQNQILLNCMTGLMRTFHERGMKTLILKGIALILLYYQDFGLRPMDDFDVLVPAEKAPEAVHLLQESGWKSRFPLPEKFAGRYRSYKHGHMFQDPSGHELDLHWRVFPSCPEPNADDDLWKDAVSTCMGDVPTLALNPADQLLHVISHGAWWNMIPPVRWVADAMIILNSNTDIHWERLINQAGKRRLILPARETLSYLHERLEAPVPLEVLKRLRNRPVSKTERFEYKARRLPNDSRGPFIELGLQYIQYSRAEKKSGLLKCLLRFPRFLQISWRIDHLWRVPLVIVTKGLGRIRKITEIYWRKIL